MTALRCAIYTRKSSEEGLDQAFNSLEAQREAGADYIKSQRHTGWVCLPVRYDDGGYSGGSTARPGLQRLLEDIRAGRIDVVLVYKVDRLSRSLADFARLMQVFDEHRVSFVSVTQQFNTTTSMGRLTLNMLLSFAQFEREVAGERIRDKIAATKRKGVWVCGQPPLGYAIAREGDPDFTPGQRSLRVVEDEAGLVRAIYAGYLELGSLVGLARRLNDAGHRTKRWAGRGGAARGGRPFTTLHLHRILTNPLYIGKVTHTRGRGPDAVTDVHDGLHEPIIDRATWDRVRAAMDLDRRRATSAWTHTHLLKGKVRTHEGHALSPGSTQRPRSKVAGRSDGVRRVRYYISQKAIKHGYDACPIKSINAEHLDDLVRAVVLDHLGAGSIDLRAIEPAARDQRVREVLRQVTVGPERLEVDLDDAAVERLRQEWRAGARGGKAPQGDRVSAGSKPPSRRGGRREKDRDPSDHAHPHPHPHPHAAVPACLFQPRVETVRDGAVTITRLCLDVRIKRHDGKRLLLAADGQDLLSTPIADGRPTPRPHLVRALAQAHAWREALLERSAATDRGQAARRAGRSGPQVPTPTIAALAHAAGLTPPRIKLLLPLAHLSPQITAAVLTGTLSPRLTLHDLLAAAAHADWEQQAASLGLRAPDRPHPHHT